MEDFTQRIHKMAAAEAANPDIVNKTLPVEIQQRYFRLLFRYTHLLATDLSDIAEPARVPHFEVRTFGEPAFTAPIRLSPAHAAFLRQEISDAKAANLMVTGVSPWSAGCFVVPKPRSEKLRLVVDFRRLNA
jgi:hypothetical protein